MLTQLRKLFGGGKRTSSPKSSAAPATHTGFRPATERSDDSHPALGNAAPPAPETMDEDVNLPLQSVLNALPPELKRCVVPMDLGGATLTVAMPRILSQLPTGSVKLSFGMLREAAPQLFSVGAEFDARDIELPLNEILVRINPALLPRPAKQKAAVTDTIEDSFIVPASASPAAPRANKPPSPGPIRVPIAPAAPETAVSSPTSSKQPPARAPRDPITVSLASLSAAWPTEIREEIKQLKCADSQVALPEQLVKLGMKQGKVAFPWQTIRAWIQPPLPSVVSKHDNLTLNLPLEVLMPLFVSRLKQAPRTQSRLVVDEDIPALFGPVADESPASAPEEKPVATTDASGVADAAPGDKPKTPATDFKNRYISPSEVVNRAAALDGVAGTLVVLPEGLLVAAKVAGDQNPDALAAFLARALGRVNSCAEEAQIGEVSQLEFTAEGVPWKIFRLHGVLFAAFGSAGGTLPQPDLASIAGEFDRKKRG